MMTRIRYETDSGVNDDDDDDSLCDTSFNGIGYAPQVAMLHEVTRAVWQDAKEFEKAAAKRPGRKQAGEQGATDVGKKTKRGDVRGTRSDGNVRVHWVEAGKPVAAPFGSGTSNATVAIARRGYPIAETLVARMKREVRGTVVSLTSAIAGRAAAEELQRTVVSKEGLAAFHPAHAAYVYAQNQVSVMSEQLTALDEMAPFAAIVARAEDLYRPSEPPLSPLTTSYFACWAFFDACVEPSNETIGTTVLEVGAAFGMHTGLLRLIRLMQESRMGLYVHEGAAGDRIILRELATAAMCHAIGPSGYRGQRGELWYARVLPPPIPGGSEHVVFTTPYVLLEPGIPEWQAYLRRTLPDAPKQARIEANERHMKYGPTRTYWNDFVFEGYARHRTEAIYLAGLPDVPESRPHSPVNSRRVRR